MRPILILAVAALASTALPVLPAAAEPTASIEVFPPDDRPSPVTYEMELSTGSIGEVLRGLAPRNGFHADAFVSGGATGDTTGERLGVVTAGGSLATGGLSDRCRYLSVEGAVSSSAAETGSTTSASSTATVCLFKNDVVNLGAPGFAISHHLEYDVKPALSARRLWLRRRFTGQRISVEGSAFEAHDVRLPYGAAIFPYRVDVDLGAQEGEQRVLWSFETEGLRITPPRAIVMGDIYAPDAIIRIPADDLALLGLFVRGTDTELAQIIVGGLDLGRIAGLSLGRGWTLDAKLGFAFGSVSPHASMVATVDVTTPRGFVAATLSTEHVQWTGRFEHDAQPTFDAAIAVEERATSTAVMKRWLPGVELAGFFAYTRLYEVSGTTGDWTGGASVKRAWQLGDHLTFAVSGEVARSYYARLDAATDARPVPETAARAMATLTARVGTR
jgi:hypothetical protein